MILKIITPIGPGHNGVSKDAERSVEIACEHPHSWSNVIHELIDDTQGNLGRSRARNSAINGAHYYFFLDADDEMMPDALRLVDWNAPATFGTVRLNGKNHRRDIYPCTRKDVIRHVNRTLVMGFFYRDIGIRFDESLDAGEDMDFYLRLPSWTKINQPLVNIRTKVKSATGPRGYESLDWTTTCKNIIAQHE